MTKISTALHKSQKTRNLVKQRSLYRTCGALCIHEKKRKKKTVNSAISLCRILKKSKTFSKGLWLWACESFAHMKTYKEHQWIQLPHCAGIAIGWFERLFLACGWVETTLITDRFFSIKLHNWLKLIWYYFIDFFFSL